MNKVAYKEQISIITPVFNRLKELTRLYESLSNQTNNNFIWIIVDDGSEEKIDKIVDNWEKQSKFKINLIVQSNQGKMYAYKNAIKYLSTPWSLIVDSDDTVSKEMIDILYKTIFSIGKGNDCGAVFPRKMDTNSNEISLWKELPDKVNIIDLRYQYNIPESAIFVKTDKLKKAFNSLQLPDEKFISEEILYNKLMEQGKFVVRNELFYFGDYQDDGLTNHLFKLWLRNPVSTIMLLNSRYRAMNSFPWKKRLIGRWKTNINLTAFALATNRSIKSVSPNLIESILLFLPALILKRKRF